MTNEEYFSRKENKTFFNSIHVWIELKHYPHDVKVSTAIRSALLEDLKKCNIHSARTNGDIYEAYLLIICSGYGTFGGLIADLEQKANQYTNIIPIYLEE